MYRTPPRSRLLCPRVILRNPLSSRTVQLHVASMSTCAHARHCRGAIPGSLSDLLLDALPPDTLRKLGRRRVLVVRSTPLG